jgi:hypothetical protein
VLRFRLMVERGPHSRPQASEGEAQHGPFCRIGRISAHHIAHLGGDAQDHIVAWARMRCPWMAAGEAAAIAAEVMAHPVKWKADTLGWRLGLTDAQRTALKITTIGGIDVSEAERLERRKEKRRAADRARRAKRSTGKPRGRPRKNARPADSITIAGRAINASKAAALATPESGYQEAIPAAGTPTPPQPRHSLAHLLHPDWITIRARLSQ